MSGTFLRYLLLSIVSVAALSAISSAYTVTLTGSCSLGAITNAHSYMTFNLSNSGDGPAQQVAISPIISGATTNQSEIYIPSLNANTSNVSKIYLQNLSSNGTYIESFVVVYNQGSSTFVTLYPCEQYINKFTQSSLLIANMTQKGGKVEASMLNYGPYAIDANVSFLTSPLYALQNATRNETVSIAPGGIATVSFGYKPIVGNYSFPASVAAQYYHNGSHYATIYTIKLLPKSPVGLLSFGMLELLIIAAVVVIVALIIASLLVGRKKKPKQASQSQHS